MNVMTLVSSIIFLMMSASLGNAQVMAPPMPPDCNAAFFNPFLVGCLYTPPWYAASYAMAPNWLQIQQWQTFPSYVSPQPLDFSRYVGLKPNPESPLVSSSAALNSQIAQTAILREANFQNQVRKEVLPSVNELNTHQKDCECTPGTFQTTPFSPLITLDDSVKDCVETVRDLPGSHKVPSDFIEKMATDPDNPNVVYGLSADLSSTLSPNDQAMYITKSTDGGKTWNSVARINSQYFDINALEGLRNGFTVGPKDKNGIKDLVITTKKGVFQLTDPPQTEHSKNSSGLDDAKLTPIGGAPRIPKDPDIVASVKKLGGDPVLLGVGGKGDPRTPGEVKIKGDHMIVSYGNYWEKGQVISYHRDEAGKWSKEKALPDLPDHSMILSLEYDPKNPDSCYVGTAQHAYHLAPDGKKWIPIAGLKGDSAVQGMCLDDGLHMVACGGVYGKSNVPDKVERAHSNNFDWRSTEIKQDGTLLRSYAIEVNHRNPREQIVAASTGVYASNDGGTTWNKVRGLPSVAKYAHNGDDQSKHEGLNEFRAAHFAADGSGAVTVSSYAGTFVIHPFSSKCSQ